MSCITVKPYQVSVVGRAGALLSDAHTETGQAAIFVFLAEVEGSRLTAGARRAFDVHLQHRFKEMRYKAVRVYSSLLQARICLITLQRHTAPLQPSLPFWSQL